MSTATRIEWTRCDDGSAEAFCSSCALREVGASAVAAAAVFAPALPVSRDIRRHHHGEEQERGSWFPRGWCHDRALLSSVIGRRLASRAAASSSSCSSARRRRSRFSCRRAWISSFSAATSGGGQGRCAG